MATYLELFALSRDSELRNKITVACVKKAQTLLDGASPTTPQIEWAKGALDRPEATAADLIYYVLAANSALTVAQIQAATDSSIQTNVDAAVDVLST